MSTQSPTHIEVEAQPDHLDLLTKASPVLAVAELIWNAFDADAHKVRVSVVENILGNVEQISVEDDGHGLPYADAETAFGHLGGSWKKTAGRTLQEKRILHGKEGKGRFRAFALGNHVTWEFHGQTTK